ncbi:DUF2849 domain-containing protein [Phaeovulum sp.]|uniref:DUF2849 domain-containing protein n=1 Tax=Phaeovulum sp. TaxID=2934796 RepID=UPI003567028C
MAQHAPATVVTANALRSGKVVWLTASDDWSHEMRAACVYLDAAQAEAALARAQARMGEVVGCYLAEVRPTPQGPEPLHFREVFRRDGPSHAARIPA